MEKYFKRQTWYIITMSVIAIWFIVSSLVSGMYAAALGFACFLGMCSFYYRDLVSYRLTFKTMEFNREWGDNVHRIATEAIEAARKGNESNADLIEKYSEVSSAFRDALRLVPRERWCEFKPETQQYINRLCENISDAKSGV